MLDLRAIRDDPAPARAALARRGFAEQLDELLALDARRRELLPEVEGRRAQQNEASDEIAARKRAGGDASDLIERMKGLSVELKGMQAELSEVEQRRDALAATLPNLPHPEAPDGGEDDAVVLREVGECPSFEFEVRDHLDLGIEHGWIEVEQAAAASGSRFAYLLGDLVMVELALVRFAVELVRAEGFEPIVPPVLVREGPLYGTGYFPAEREMIYEIERDELFLIGTSEVPLAALHADQILEAADREALRLVHRDRRDQRHRHLHVVAGHHHLRPRRKLRHPRHVRRPEVELRPVPVEERRVTTALFLRQDVAWALNFVCGVIDPGFASTCPARPRPWPSRAAATRCCPPPDPRPAASGTSPRP